jgi:(p)ppGpp synthase/HD superfamily hydrolase
VNVRLTERFSDALVYARELHAGQYRKETGIPYMAHLMSAAALVLEAGGDEDEAIAALLHDAVEDQGGRKTLAEIHSLFGEKVADIVAACSDAFTNPKPPWEQRKSETIAALRQALPGVRRVSLADKLHNARSIVADLHQVGPAIWDRFKMGKQGTLWYYRSLAGVFKQTGDDFMTAEFVRVVTQMEQLADQAANQTGEL